MDSDRAETMTEEHFWSALEFRICRELGGMEDKNLRRMWCDGIRGGINRPQAGPANISGTIWIGLDGQTEMPFTMVLPATISLADERLWRDLLPLEDLTGWLSIDFQRRRVTIHLSKAEPLEI